MLPDTFKFITNYSPGRLFTATRCARGFDVSWEQDGTHATLYKAATVEENVKRKAWLVIEEPTAKLSLHMNTHVGANTLPTQTQVTQAPLDKRKVGKNQMNLVDSGFPNAFQALGAVMTWAAENKGYLPDDWKNIAEPDRAFAGAAARHRNDRLRGITKDKESNMLHLAHEAFNVLALLELTLTGVIK